MLNLISNTPTVVLICVGVLVYILYQALCFNLESDTSFEYTTTLGQLKENQVFQFEDRMDETYIRLHDNIYREVGTCVLDYNFCIHKGIEDHRVVVQGVLSE
jgi:hypothetical protein